MMMREAYVGLIALRALWHLSGVYASPSSDALVGTLLMGILDHFTLALVCGRGDEESSLKVLFSFVLMWGVVA